MDYSAFADKLTKFIPLPMTVLGILFIGLLIFLFIALKMKFLKESWIYLVCGFIGIVLAYFFTIYPVQKDIREKTYIEYHRNFIIDEYYFTSRSSSSTMMIRFSPSEKAEKFKTIEEFHEITLGKIYQGTICYGKHSKMIIEIEIK